MLFPILRLYHTSYLYVYLPTYLNAQFTHRHIHIYTDNTNNIGCTNIGEGDINSFQSYFIVKKCTCFKAFSMSIIIHCILRAFANNFCRHTRQRIYDYSKRKIKCNIAVNTADWNANENSNRAKVVFNFDIAFKNVELCWLKSKTDTWSHWFIYAAKILLSSALESQLDDFSFFYFIAMSSIFVCRDVDINDRSNR